MRSKRYRFWSHDNRFRLMLTLGLAVLLPAAALIYVNLPSLEVHRSVTKRWKPYPSRLSLCARRF